MCPEKFKAKVPASTIEPGTALKGFLFWWRTMKLRRWIALVSRIVAAGVFVWCAVASGNLVQGQQIPQIAEHRAGAAYDVARESVISGEIVQYSSVSTMPPLGAHISLQTGSGTIEVHAGNARVIQASNISLQPGNSVSITGETVQFGKSTVFVARLIQKGSQSVAVRSKNGVPLLPTAVNANGKIVSPAGVR
jgi:hypothetical protein